MTARLPMPGEVVAITDACSVQFAGQHFLFRVIHHYANGSTPTGWTWLTGYVLDQGMEAIHRREVLVQVGGLSFVRPPANRGDNRSRIVRAAANAGHVRIPEQRTKKRNAGGIR